MDEVSYAEFENPNFDAKELVQRYRKRIPLPHLQKSLRAHHATTRQELIELINEKYADFVSLSSRMQGVERALRPLRSPLEDSCELTKGLQTKLGGLLQKAEEAHDRLGRIQARKDALHAYLENARLLAKVKASSEAKWSGNAEAFLREHLAQEGIARELRRIRINLQGAINSAGSEGAPECSTLLEEAMAYQETFSRQLEEKLRRLATASRESWEAQRGETTGGSVAFSAARSELAAISQTSRALCTVGHGELVERVFAEVFAKVVLDEAVAACNAAAEEAKRKAMADTSTGGSGKIFGAGAVDLGVFVAVATQGLLQEGAPLLWFARKLRGGGAADADEALAVPSLRLVAFSGVLPALQRIQEVWPNVFMPAFPDLFAANYSHFSKFLRAGEEAMDAQEAECLRRDPALSEFQRRWKTQVYCSLRTKEAAQRLDTAAKRPLGDEPTPREALGRQYWLETSAELLQTIHLVWGDWYLSCLYPKMVRLALELVARYSKVMANLANGAAVGEGVGWDAGASPPRWSAASLPSRLSRAAADLLKVREDLGVSPSPGAIAKLVLDRLPATADGQKPTELTVALLSDASEGLLPALTALKDVMLKQVVAAIVPQFAAIRGIPAFYRMLNKPVPTQASPYVESAIRPLTAFQDVLAGAAVGSSDAAAEWLCEVVDGASQEFTSQATQLIELTRQQEASLRRLGGRGSGGEVSDLEKIHLQLCLDVDTFVRLALKSAPSSQGLTKLTEAVAGIRRTEGS